MRHSLAAAFGLMATLVAAYPVAAAPTDGWPVFQGTWFDIKYPSGFAPRAGLPDGSSDRGSRCKSAFFKSPDGSVEFYVFSPLRSGEPTDYLINRETEACVSWSCEESKGSKLIYTELRAKDGSYRRASVVITLRDQTVHAFGIRYESQDAYNKYRSRYLAFKASLVQCS